ncbi:TBC1 domain family member 22B [Musca vetustissima]|uniref:TBC1 domain family member 22B n=1 Tax=Musca vetustissima TaxID=27455 RepID=UPI002AB636B6|nr:TBC1 domain family member 22B [Musca vetustissima]
MDNNADNNAKTTTNLANTSTQANKTSSVSSSSLSSSSSITHQQHQIQQISTTATTITTSSTNSFWKNSNRVVPGRPSPKRDTNSLSSAKVGGGVGGAGHSGGMMATFRDYQNSVSDAWDTGDDEFCIISNATQQQQLLLDPRISRQVSQTLAQNVIEVHKMTTNNSTVSAGGGGGATSTQNTMTCNNNATTNETHNTAMDNSAKNVAESMTTAAAKQMQKDLKLQDSDDIRPRIRHIQALPGRPQLQKFTSNSQDSEYETKIEKFQVLLDSPLLDLVALKKLSWSGIPRKMRAISWRLLSKYLPPSGERRNGVLESKRQNYQDLRHNYFRVDSPDESQQDTYRQIHIDVPRMNPQISLFQQKLVQEMFERILFIWSIRHPASGYVQGINDLVTPFFIVFLQENLPPGTDIEKFNMESLSVEIRDAIEADAFWCLSKFLDCIQDNYIFAQLGIQEKVNQLKDLIQRIDGNLHRHLQQHGVDYLQFSFRWMNNLLTRELPLHCTIRLWDTYLAESDGFALFHLYVCAAFLLHWKEQLMQQVDFQGLLLLLQNLPTHNWSDRQINVLVAEAFRLKFTYADAPKHLEAKS